MNSRQRFLASLLGGSLDRPPLFPEGMREETLRAWRRQGLPRRTRLDQLFTYDEFEELSPDIYPSPDLTDWSNPSAALRELRRRLDADDSRRLPDDWVSSLAKWKIRSHPLFLRIHQGLFLSLGIEDWRRFSEVMLLLVDEPGFVDQVLGVQAEFAARLADNILQQVAVDAVVFSEPIAGPHGPLVSPRMYRRYFLSSLEPIFSVLSRWQVPVVIWRSYANPRALIPDVVKAGFNAIWACETPPGAIDYHHLRASMDPLPGLIGGIDADVLYQGESQIHAAVDAVLPLVKLGGFIPLADGRVREDVPFENYACYRRYLADQLGI